MNRFAPVVPVVLAACLTSLAQPSGLLKPVKGDGQIWLKHTVAPKENWYSVARVYHIGPKDIAAYNSTEISKPLNIGQALRIPLREENFTQTGMSGPDEALVPLYHIVAEKEGLFRIGQDYNYIGIEQLRVLNKLPSDAIRAGMRLVVGYLKVAKGQQEWAGRSVASLMQGASSVVSSKPSVVETKTELPTPKPSSQPTSAATREPMPTYVSTPADPLRNRLDTNISPGGYFEPLFREQLRSGTPAEQTVLVASFKSTSGWKDGKYYLLMNGVVPSTVVRVTHAATGRFIHAKVLGELPPIRENEKLAARMSNAAFSALDLPEGTHELLLEWIKP